MNFKLGAQAVDFIQRICFEEGENIDVCRKNYAYRFLGCTWFKKDKTVTELYYAESVGWIIDAELQKNSAI